MKMLLDTFKDTSLFRRVYIICLFFCNISFIQIPAYVCLVLLFIWGVALLIYNEITKHTFQKLRFGAWILIFLLFTTITAIIHIQDNFLFNMMIELHIAICFFIFYGVHTETSFNFRREAYQFCKFMIYLSTIIGVIGLSLMMAGISFEILWVKFIIYENRFTSIYTNPNILGYVSVLSLVCTHMLVKKDFIELSQKPRVSRIWLVASLAVNSICLFLCDSNSSIVLAICYCIFYLAYRLFGTEISFSIKQYLTKIIAMVCVGAFIIGAMFTVRTLCQRGFTSIVDSANISTEVAVKDTTNKDGEDELLAATSRVTFNHENKNIDSGRITLLKQAAHMFEDFPLFGIGKGNIYSYGKMMFPSGVKFSNTYGESLSQFLTDFHNGYATILVCSGAFGFIVFAIFGLRFAKHMTVNVFRDHSLSQSILPCMYSFLCAYLVYSIFEKALLYDVSFIVLTFWLFMGYTACFLTKYEPDHQNSIYVLKHRFRKVLF